MGCGCKGSSYLTPTERQQARQAAREQRTARAQTRIRTDPHNPRNYWNGPQPKQG